MSLVADYSMREALEREDLLGATLKGASWAAWHVLLIGALGEKLSRKERRIFERLTKREREPGRIIEEFWVIAGRRSGKSRAIAALVVFFAVIVRHQHVLAPGEWGAIQVLSASKGQAKKIMEYVEGTLRTVPEWQDLVQSVTADSITLRNQIEITIAAASFRTIRSSTSVLIVADEICFWRSGEGVANPDTEILGAARPSLATTGGMLACISSPHARKGEAYQTYKRHYGPDGDELILVAQAASLDLNPSLSRKVVERAYEKDTARASAEYGGQFRTDIESFIDRELVESLVMQGRRELPYIPGKVFHAFCDPSGGRSDSMTLGIAHRQGEMIVLDLVREVRPPFSPDAVVEEFSEVLKIYRIGKVIGDSYGGEWPVSAFRKHGVTYERCEISRSDIYKTILPVLNSRRVELLDNARLVDQLSSLERRVGPGGKDQVNHPETGNGHDDVINAAGGAIWAASSKTPMIISDELIQNMRRMAPDPRYGRPMSIDRRMPRMPMSFQGSLSDHSNPHSPPTQQVFSNFVGSYSDKFGK
ncbi:hypothetical protein ACMDCR_25835 [Labrys okinawensis]|uniref:hypothetical protein n=1 Tax=Labrys okinawensis TaxID=346911 RepID=UPI0039BCB18A